jgi:hypothetical protein
MHLLRSSYSTAPAIRAEASHTNSTTVKESDEQTLEIIHGRPKDWAYFTSARSILTFNTPCFG